VIWTRSRPDEATPQRQEAAKAPLTATSSIIKAAQRTRTRPEGIGAFTRNLSAKNVLAQQGKIASCSGFFL
jgi:hypothetical protein